MINWSLLQNLEKDTSLFSVFPEAAPLGEHFYRIGEEAYAQTWDMSNSVPGPGPFIVFIAWAPSVGAARRVLCRDAAGDDGALGTPPNSLLLEPDCTSYAAIRKSAETGRFGRFYCTSASAHPASRYWIAVGDRLTYCFRDPAEPPYAITIDCRDIRWNLCG
jgi:hypothetical protein